LAGFITLPCLWAVTLLVARQPEGLAWMALFSVAHQVRQVVLQVPSLLNVVMFAVLSRIKGEGDVAAFRQVFRSTLLLGVGFTALVVGTLTLLADFVLALFGPGFLAGRMLLLVLLLSTLPEVLAATIYQLVQSRGRMWHSLLLIALPRDVGYVALTSVLLSAWGLRGTAAAYLAAQILGLVLTVAVVRLTASSSIHASR
jgi:O-antigen/teichoic acid export membrane protein